MRQQPVRPVQYKYKCFVRNPSTNKVQICCTGEHPYLRLRLLILKSGLLRLFKQSAHLVQRRCLPQKHHNLAWHAIIAMKVMLIPLAERGDGRTLIAAHATQCGHSSAALRHAARRSTTGWWALEPTSTDKHLYTP